MDVTIFLTRFAVESAKHCDQLEKELLLLETQGASRQRYDSLFRIAHTIKGASRMLKLTSIAELAHRMEDVLEELRSERRMLSQDVMDCLLAAVDELRGLAERIATGKPLPETLPTVCRTLETWLAEDALTEVAPPGDAETLAAASTPSTNEGAASTQTAFVQIRSDRLDELIQLMGELVSFQYRKKVQTDTLRELVGLTADASAAVERSGCAQEAAERVAVIHSRMKRVHESLRDEVAVEQLLINELQERTLQIRMMPIAAVADKIKRGVRDFAKENGKQVEFSVAGGDTELDRKIIEQLGDCLIHMVRNAVDHGIELPAVRAAQGKNPCGQICLAASYDGGGVTLTVQDDGAGIDLTEIKRSALQKRLIDETVADKMTETELLELLFLPGFSTSPLITDVSGRGVGMNVVKQTIVEELKGSVRIQSSPGEGTKIFLNVPITLALSRMLIVAAGNQRIAFPAYAVQEVLAVAQEQVIDVLMKQAVRIRDQIVPLETLAALLDCPQRAAEMPRERLVIVLAAGLERLGVVVDAVLSEADMVIKSLPDVMDQWPLLAGFTVGGNDEVISVLDVGALVRRSRETGIRQTEAREAGALAQQKKILVVDDSANTRDIVKSILESYGYQIDLAEDGLVALEKTGRKLYDAVITDVEMPQLDGFALTAHLRQDERYRQVPVIIVTSREKVEDKRRGIQVGANAYIVKGAFDQNNLLDTLQHLLG